MKSSITSDIIALLRPIIDSYPYANIIVALLEIAKENKCESIIYNEVQASMREDRESTKRAVEQKQSGGFTIE